MLTDYAKQLIVVLFHSEGEDEGVTVSRQGMTKFLAKTVTIARIPGSRRLAKRMSDVEKIQDRGRTDAS